MSADLCMACHRPLDGNEFGGCHCLASPSRGWPAMPDVRVECPECGRDFEPDDPDQEWCAPCAAADRWANE